MEHNINREFNQIFRHVRRSSGAQSRQSGLGPGEMRTLHFIHHNPGTTQQEITKKTGINKAATARQCASLEEKGLIIRTNNENDGRSKLLFPAEKAISMKEEHHSNEQLIFEQLLEDFTEEEIDELKRLLQKMCDRIRKDKGDRS